MSNRYVRGQGYSDRPTWPLLFVFGLLGSIFGIPAVVDYLGYNADGQRSQRASTSIEQGSSKGSPKVYPTEKQRNWFADAKRAAKWVRLGTESGNLSVIRRSKSDAYDVMGRLDGLFPRGDTYNFCESAILAVQAAADAALDGVMDRAPRSYATQMRRYEMTADLCLQGIQDGVR